MPRVVVLGTGTAVGKTYVTCAIARALHARLPRAAIVCVKPIETGVRRESLSKPSEDAGDARSIRAADTAVRAVLEGASLEEHGTRPAAVALSRAPVAGATPVTNAARDGTSLPAMHESVHEGMHAATRESVHEAFQMHADDAALLENVCFHARAPSPHPLFALSAAVSPHRAARLERVEIDLERIPRWVNPNDITLHDDTWLLIESAGGVFSPLARDKTNLDLALLLEPALWLLVAPDALGVLHDLSTTLCAMRARARPPDVIVLSAARAIDESTGGNLQEATELGIARPVATLARDDTSGVEAVVDVLLAMSSAGARERL